MIASNQTTLLPWELIGGPGLLEPHDIQSFRHFESLLLDRSELLATCHAPHIDTHV